MQFFELICKAYLKRDIEFKSSFEVISKFISFVISNGDFKDLHFGKGFKHYVFKSFYPLEKDKIYKKGETYEFTIRSLSEDLIDYLSNALRENINNPNFQVLTTTKRVVKQHFITELYTLSPTIVSISQGKFWTMEQSGDILLLQRLLHDNLEKKYNDFYKLKLNPMQNFIQLLEIKNRKPQNILISKNGKSIRFFGNKFRIIPHEDEVSQKLAFMALGAGLGEKNSFGGGFCLGKGVMV